MKMIATVHVEYKTDKNLKDLRRLLRNNGFEFVVANQDQLITLDDATKIQTFMHYDPHGKPTVFG